jgi:hypothetical protein
MQQFGFSANLSETELKALCKTRGLRFRGAKAVLVARLVEFDRAVDAPGYVVIFCLTRLTTELL